MEHPILEKLVGSQYEWLREVLLAFNSGNISAWTGIQSKYAEELNRHDILKANKSKLDQKIAILSVIELVFHKQSHDRRLTFNELSKVVHLPLHEVEFLIMRALSLGLLKGSIDEVDQVFEVTWVQPRTLSLPQIGIMRNRLNVWTEDVKKSLNLMENEMTPELIS